tara:strand:+ start:2321 stop:2947 length:627 start_codon:yes stop_codon:yes gene_type:complete
MLIKRCVILFSGTGSNLENLLKNEFLHSNKLRYISAFTDNPVAKGISVCESFDLNVKISSKEKLKLDLEDYLKTHDPDLIVLSGYMRIIPDDIVKKYEGRIINIHPSLLPKYPGLDTYEKVIENKDRSHGVTIHFVTEELDGGPVILQGEFKIDEKLSINELKSKTHVLEYEIFPKVIMWFANDLIQLKSDKVFFKNKEIKSPIVYVR